jgi:hypothetical protein
MAAQVRRVLFQVSLVAFLALALGVGQAASASLIAYDQFNYTVGNTLTGQSGGSGWTGAWQAGVGGTSNTVAAGLSLGTYPVAGGAGQMYSTNNSYSTGASRQLNVTASGYLWMSFLCNNNTSTWQALYTEDLVQTGTLKTFYRVNTGGNGDDWQDRPAGIATGASSANTAAINNSNGYDDISSDTYLIVAEVTNVGGAGNQTETIWVLNAANYAALTTKDETDLNGHCVTSATQTGAYGFTLSPGDLVQLITNKFSSGSVIFTVDELKYGTDSVSVLSAVPEPATMALLGFGAVAMLVKRRRR